MEFQIHHEHRDEARGPNGLDIIPGNDSWQWSLVKADGEVLARGPRVFYDEKACRSQIAQAKKAMKGAMRCKVVTLDA